MSERRITGQREMGAMEIPVRSPRDPDMVEIKVKPESGKGNNGEGSLANLKTVGGKGTSDGKNGSDNTEENKKKLTAYTGTKKKRLRFRYIK